MSQPHPRKIVKSSTESLSRLAEAKAEVARSTDPSNVKVHMNRVTHPNSMSSTAKKAGIALIAAPDPITGIPGVALLASSYVLKSKDPASLANLAQETRKLLRDIQSSTL